MEEEKIQKILESTQKVSLSSGEKEELKSKLLIEVNKPRAVRSGYVGFFPNILRPVYVLPILAIFILTAGVSFAAEGALPGDFLYPVKVAFNEKAAGLADFKTTQKAERQVALLEKRFTEVQKLVSENKATDNALVVASEQIEKHYDALNQYSAELESSGKVEDVLALQRDVKVSLSVNQKVFQGVAATRSFSSLKIDSLGQEVKEEVPIIAVENVFLSKENIEEISNDKLKSAQEALKEAESAVSKSGLADNEIESLEGELKEIRLEIKRSQVYLETGSPDEASGLLDDAYQKAKEIKILLNVGIKPDISKIENEEDLDINRINVRSSDNGEVKGQFKAVNVKKAN